MYATAGTPVLSTVIMDNEDGSLKNDILEPQCARLGHATYFGEEWDAKPHASMGKPSRQHCSSHERGEIKDKIQASSVHEGGKLVVKWNTGTLS